MQRVGIWRRSGEHAADVNGTFAQVLFVAAVEVHGARPVVAQPFEITRKRWRGR